MFDRVSQHKISRETASYMMWYAQIFQASFFKASAQFEPCKLLVIMTYYSYSWKFLLISHLLSLAKIFIHYFFSHINDCIVRISYLFGVEGGVGLSCTVPPEEVGHGF